MTITDFASPSAPPSREEGRPLRLSALDLMPVRAGQSSHDAVAASLQSAQVADASGYTRYWLAEHHNMPTFAITTPAVAIAQIAASTDTIKLGSGGVMLPNHNPLLVAEQFALLEAAYPGRVDLGIGRAPGGDPITSRFLRQGRVGEDFADQLAEVRALLGPEGLQLGGSGPAGLPIDYTLRATPSAASVPEVWLLGSSPYSASLAARNGMPYVFDHHFLLQGTGDALDIYRQEFQPSEALAAPKTLITVTAVVAASQEEAEARALPMLQTMARIVAGEPLQPLALVDDAIGRDLPAQQLATVEEMREKWIVGTPTEAAAQVRATAAEFGVEEVMVNTVASAYRDEPAGALDPRAETLRLLGRALGLDARESGSPGAGLTAPEKAVAR